MKKLITNIAVVLILVTLITGCTTNNDVKQPELKDGVKLSDVTKKVEDEIGIQMGADIDDVVLEDMFYVKKDDIDEYSGKFSMVMTSADNFVAIKAKDGKIDTVKESLEKRKEDIKKSFEQYLPDQSVKAQAGKVVTKGNYAFLIILGDTMVEDGQEFDSTNADAIVAKAEEIINSFFN